MGFEGSRELYELAVLACGLLLLTLLVLRGTSIFLAAPLAAACTLALSGADPVAGLSVAFMKGFAEYIRQFYFIFVLGAVFGRLIDRSGAAASIAEAVVRSLGPRWASLAVVLACAVLTYGGVSLFVVGFAVFPLAVSLFRQADLPRRFIPGAMAFGSITFTMTSAGSPEIQNLIPIRYLVDSRTGEPLTDAMAAWPVSLIVAATMFLAGQAYLQWAVARDRSRGGRFEPRSSDPPCRAADELPGWLRSAVPLVVTLVALNVLPAYGEYLEATAPEMNPLICSVLLRFRDDPGLAILAGIVAACVTLRRHLIGAAEAAAEGFGHGLVAIGSTASVVGFGTALGTLPAFDRMVHWVTHLPTDPLIGAALAVAVIAGISGSASGGQGIALPLVKPVFIDQLGVAPRALHRVVAIASGSLDSMPANGYLVTLIRTICGETYRAAYGPVFVVSVVIPLIGTAEAIALLKLVPAWGEM